MLLMMNAYYILRATTPPDCIFTVAGDFSHSDLKTTLTRFYRSVGIETRKDKSLDQVYRKALGQSDDLRLFLTQTTLPDSADTGSLWSLMSRTAGRELFEH